jgi:hypothetical protein
VHDAELPLRQVAQAGDEVEGVGAAGHPCTVSPLRRRRGVPSPRLGTTRRTARC